MNKDTRALLTAEGDQLAKLKGIVQTAIDDEKLIIDNLLNPPKEVLSRGQKISDKVAVFGGSWAFIISFFVILICWILYNSIAPTRDDFDPYPFILMNLILSCVAALQAPIIMMSQNRKEEKDRLRAENDYLVNLKSELELRALHKKIDLLLEEQIKVLFDSQARQIDLLRSLEKKVDKLCAKTL
jgi:uncharacterized membrane protein